MVKLCFRIEEPPHTFPTLSRRLFGKTKKGRLKLTTGLKFRRIFRDRIPAPSSDFPKNSQNGSIGGRILTNPLFTFHSKVF
ncbi:hypothetical protein DLM75_06985 [Leptospira stimsonii]|uniref:Uncharacterized protein n=1 Tax=Leptospira stimsonii TaxID=2202203 RepID=A0A396ZBC6_9LEPT|nr:hypothetical protein DLM75_06985 [Leptospira stimsonii]